MTKHFSALSSNVTTLNSVNVVFGSDRPFLPYTAVALQSLLSNYKDHRNLRIFLLVDQPLSDDDQRRFESLTAGRPFELNVIVADASAFKNIRTTNGITTPTYYRLYMHLLLPPDVDKAIWLDGDVIVRSDISELFDIEMGDTLFAGVEDTLSNRYRRQFNLEATAKHINCGVLVSNVSGMRRFDFLRKIEDFITDNKYIITLGDQQIINTLFRDRLS